jgi:hypothetical protein
MIRTAPAYGRSRPSNALNTSLPQAGNFWDTYDTPAEGCADLNNDRICDDPYTFLGGTDNLPWVRESGVFPKGLVIASEFVII